MDILTLLDNINFPNEYKEEIISTFNSLDLMKYIESVKKMTVAESSEQGYLELKELLGDDPHNKKIFVLEIYAGVLAYDKYKELGIPDSIYFNTMTIFTRYINRYVKDNGTWGFDRAFWAHRHTSLRLFRLYTLEFEYTEIDGENVISVHIPPDATLTEEPLKKSFRFAREFTNKFFPEYKDRKIVTESWLVSPRLKPLLKENSNILKFMNMFNVVLTAEFEGAIKFLFGINTTFNLKEIDIENLPENTSLQKSVKELYLKGETIGSGYGYLIEE